MVDNARTEEQRAVDRLEQAATGAVGISILAWSLPWGFFMHHLSATQGNLRAGLLIGAGLGAAVGLLARSGLRMLASIRRHQLEHE